jgi:hypothetical protein
MNKRRTISLLPVAACLLALSAPAQGRRNVLRVPAQYPTISAAISAASPGDTVRVARGVYREQVIIDIPLRVEGAHAGQTIIDGENRIDLSEVGQVRVVAAGDVQFSGFTIVNAGRPGESATRAAIYTESPVAGVTYSIHHTRSIGSNDPTQSWPVRPDHGLHSEGGLEHLSFRHNEIALTTAAAIYLQRHVGPTTISDNFLDGVIDSSAVCVVASDTGVDITTPQRVCRNEINVEGNLGSAGIGIFSGYPSGLPGRFTDVHIDQNVIRQIPSGRRGISLYNASVDPAGGNICATIEDNRILADGGYIGIEVFGYMEDVEIEDNLITGITGEGFPSITGGIRLRGGVHIDPITLQRVYNGVGPINTEVSDNWIEALRGISVEGDASRNEITGNRVWALDFPTVELGADTFSNDVTRNLLRTSTPNSHRSHRSRRSSQSGDATVLDNGTGNRVARNR